MNFKEVIRANVSYNSVLNRFLVSAYHLSKYRLWKPPKLRSQLISEILDRYSQIKQQVKFIQIGSNDGISEDPLRQFIIRNRWQGVLVEPLPATFRKLLINYEAYEYKTDLFFENVAISDINEVKIFYYIDAKKANIPETSSKFSSFHKEVPLKLKRQYPSVDKYICELEIQTLTLNTLLDKYHLKEDLNLLHIDTEGHDYTILKQIDFNVTRPDIILFENLHLKLSDYKKCVKDFENNNYILFEQKLDTIALKSEYKYKLLGGTHH